MRLLQKSSTKSNIEHCKIQTLCNYLSKRNMLMDESFVFLLGLDEFLQFGLENYKQQLLWFMITYNEYCDKRIMENFDICETAVSTNSVAEIKNYVDRNKDVGVYFDYNVRKAHKEKVFSVSNTPDLHIGRFKFSSFGLIEGYDEEAFYLSVTDLDGKPIKLAFSAYEENELYKHTVLLEMIEDNAKNESHFYPIIIKNLVRACDNYLMEVNRYQYDEASKKYGVSGKSSFAALNEEVKSLICKFEESEDNNYLKILAYRLNILRLYQDKGSKSGFRNEIGKALIYLGKFDSRFKESGEKFCGLRQYWRELDRILYQVNMPYFYRSPRKYYSKFYSIIGNLASAEEAAVFHLRNKLCGE